MNMTSWMLGLGLLFSGGVAAQQQIGNGVWICDGAAQAGPCQPESNDYSSGSSSGGYTDNDYETAPIRELRPTRMVLVTGKVPQSGEPVSLFGAAGLQAESFATIEGRGIASCIAAQAIDCKKLHSYENECSVTFATADGKAGATSMFVRSNHWSNAFYEYNERDLLKLDKIGLKEGEDAYGKGQCKPLSLYGRNEIRIHCAVPEIIY